jgi:hypothetical protein
LKIIISQGRAVTGTNPSGKDERLLPIAEKVAPEDQVIPGTRGTSFDLIHIEEGTDSVADFVGLLYAVNH